MARINTYKTLHNSYFDADNYDTTFNNNIPMRVHSDVADQQYDYATTDNADVLNDRKDTEELIYQIYLESPYSDGRFINKDQLIRVPKDCIEEVFNYFKNKLESEKKLSPRDLIICINEFFDFNYEYVYKKVLTPKFKADLLEDYYNNEGFQQRMNEYSSIKLF